MRRGRYSPGQWADEMQGQDLKKFMSTSFVSKPLIHTSIVGLDPLVFIRMDLHP